MKKIVLAMAVAFLATTGVMAQDENKPERKQPTKSEMVQHRTESMAKRYGLDEQQTAKLQELNNKYADMVAVPHRGGNGRFSRGMRPVDRNGLQPKDSLQGEQKRGGLGRGQHRFDGPRGGQREKMRKMMDEYNAELKNILTDEQFKAYEADRQKMRSNRAPRPEPGDEMNQRKHDDVK
jgi:hypothetical protein